MKKKKSWSLAGLRSIDRIVGEKSIHAARSFQLLMAPPLEAMLVVALRLINQNPGFSSLASLDLIFHGCKMTGLSRQERRLNISAKRAAIDVEIHGNFVDGREIEAGSGAMLDVHNPATRPVIARIPNSTAEDIDRAMKSARAAFEGRAWGGMDIRARARLVNRLADAFEANLESLYRLGTLKKRRPLNQTRAQPSRVPDFFRYFAGLALSHRDSVIPDEGSYLNY